MKIGITADCHLNPLYPERKEVLEKIFNHLISNKVHILFILGDLFDKAQQNYSDFDSLLEKFPDLKVYIIPGNHDYNISQSHFSSSNLKVITEPEIISLANLDFLFVPYNPRVEGMDEIIAESIYKREIKKWILLSHADYISICYQPNPYEELRMYMPLFSSTIEKFKPEKVFLGHIHKPSEYGKVIYPGSPCPVDYTETGKRSFLIFDTENFKCERVPIDAPYIYFKEEIVVYPVENELELLRKELKNLIDCWKLSDEEIRKVKLYLSLAGFSKDKQVLKQKIEEFLKIKGIEVVKLDLDKVSIPVQDELFESRKEIFKMVIREFKIPKKVDEIILDEDEIKEKILEIIFRK